jgi:hypothetical protein
LFKRAVWIYRQNRLKDDPAEYARAERLYRIAAAHGQTQTPQTARPAVFLLAATRYLSHRSEVLETLSYAHKKI